MSFYNSLTTPQLLNIRNSSLNTVEQIDTILADRESSILPTDNEYIFQTVDGFAVMIGDDIESVETYEDAIEFVNTFILD